MQRATAAFQRSCCPFNCRSGQLFGAEETAAGPPGALPTEARPPQARLRFCSSRLASWMPALDVPPLSLGCLPLGCSCSLQSRVCTNHVCRELHQVARAAPPLGSTQLRELVRRLRRWKSPCNCLHVGGGSRVPDASPLQPCCTCVATGWWPAFTSLGCTGGLDHLPACHTLLDAGEPRLWRLLPQTAGGECPLRLGPRQEAVHMSLCCAARHRCSKLTMVK